MTLIANSGHASTVEESNAGHAMDIPVALPWSQRELPVPSPLFSQRSRNTNEDSERNAGPKKGRERQAAYAEFECTIDDLTYH